MKVEEIVTGKHSRGRRGGWGVCVKGIGNTCRCDWKEKFKSEWRV